MLSLLLFIFTFVQLNCENLFDVYDNPAKNDDEFTPEGIRHWNKRKYYDKIYNIGKGLMSCGERPDYEGSGNVPDMIALCEVEGDSVMNDLCHRTMLWPFRYEYLVTNSPDSRGINVGLLYNPASFHLLCSYPVAVSLPKGRPTRDILYAKGLIVNQDTLHVFVVHSPSRRGGEKGSRPARMAVAQRLTFSVDSIRQTFHRQSGMGDRHHVLIAGDFNDYSGDPALCLLEQSLLVEVSKSAIPLYNKGHKGTYFFNGKWNSLDHVFVSQRFSTWLMDCNINDHPALLEENSNGEWVPKRSFKGYKYNRGISDHLPLVARFDIDI